MHLSKGVLTFSTGYYGTRTIRRISSSALNRPPTRPLAFSNPSLVANHTSPTPRHCLQRSVNMASESLLPGCSHCPDPAQVGHISRPYPCLAANASAFLAMIASPRASNRPPGQGKPCPYLLPAIPAVRALRGRSTQSQYRIGVVVISSKPFWVTMTFCSKPTAPTPGQVTKASELHTILASSRSSASQVVSPYIGFSNM